MNILLAVDNSPHSQVAIDAVLSRVWPQGTAFKVFCAVERRQPIFAVMQREEAEAFLNKALRAAEAFTKEVADQLTERFSQCTAVNEAQFGDSKEIILDKMKWADLIVVGSHGRHGVPRSFLGSVSQTVLLFGECSTLITRYQQSHTGSGEFDNNVLVAIDEKPHSQGAFEWVLKLPWSEDARFTLLTVVADDSVEPNSNQAKKEAAMSMLEEKANELEDKVGIGKVSIEIRCGDPVDEILSMARRIPAGLIVMGAPPRGSMVRFFMGSVSQEVVLQAPCPVEVIKKKG